MATVYITQVVKARNNYGYMAEAHDFSEAEQYGPLVDVLGYIEPKLLHSPAYRETLIPKIKAVLADFKSEDYLVAVGDPAIIAICAGVIAKAGKPFNLLKWDRNSRSYTKVEIYI